MQYVLFSSFTDISIHFAALQVLRTVLSTSTGVGSVDVWVICSIQQRCCMKYIVHG